MKKDVILAILIGFILGSLSAVTLIKLPDFLKPSETKISDQQTGEITITPNQLSARLPQLTVSSPADYSVLAGKTVTIYGIADPGATVVAESPLETNIQEASASGEFSFDFDLTEGVNSFYLTGYNDTGEAKNLTLTLFYTTEKL